MSQESSKSAAMKVVKTLHSAGHRALFAGGCVRDMLLRRACSDYDVATDATPQQVRKLFPRVLLVGAKFGVAIVMIGKCKVEVATFRSDLSCTDGRRPDAVKFSSPQEDAQRRDFTINGMFLDPLTDEVIDYVGGQDDLNRRVIRTIGDAAGRFAEDHLRLIRAVRFAVRFAFEIEPATAAAIRKFAPKIISVSGERICDELRKMLSLPSACDAMELLNSLGLATHILPELFDDTGDAKWQAATARLKFLANRLETTLAFAAMLCDLKQSAIRKIARRWGAANDLADSACWIAEHKDDWQRGGEMSLAEIKTLLANENFPRLAEIWLATQSLESTDAQADEKILHSLMRRIKKIPADKINPPPLLTGDDLLEMGMKTGPAVGKILRTIRDGQLNEHISTRQQAIEMFEHHKKSH